MKQKTLFLAIALLLGLRITTAAQTPPAYVPNDGLEGWWPFNGNANDESGNGNNGTVNGATLTEDRFGNSDAAYGFDGVDDHINVGNSSSFDLNQFSISLWCNLDSTGNWNNGTNGGGFLIQKGCDNSVPPIDGYTYRIYYHMGNIVADHFALDRAYLANETESVFGNWKHIVYAYDNFYLRLYENGICLDSVYRTEATATNNENLLFGARQEILNSVCSLDDFYKGFLDDIGIWNRALTQEEITDLYNANLCYEYITVTDTLIINLGPTGFNPVTYSNTIQMYPNPSNDQLTIDYGDYATLSGYTLKIFNSIGQEIHAANIIQQQEVLPLSTWGGAGNYQVVIYNAQGVPVDTRTIVLQ